MITSARNSKLGNIRRLLSQAKARREACAFIVEGVRLTEEAWRAGWQIQMALWSDDLSPRGLALLKSLSGAGIPCEQVDAAVLRTLSDTQNPQGILAVVAQQTLPIPAPLGFVVVLDNLRDPGNLGTILRTASAAGVDAVLLSPGCADPTNPKVVRAAMGAHFHLPLLSLTWPEIAALLVDLPFYISDAAGDLPYTQADLRAPIAVLIGGEAEGPSAQGHHLLHRKISIPMPGQAESLNAAVAAAILIYEVVRQRQLKLP